MEVSGNAVQSAQNSGHLVASCDRSQGSTKAAIHDGRTVQADRRYLACPACPTAGEENA